MSEITRNRSVLVGLVLGLLLAWGGATVAQTGNLAKIDLELQERMHHSRDANETYRVIIEMTEQYNNPNLERGTALMTRAQRRDYVVNELKQFAESSQAEVMGFLTEQGTRGQVNVLHRFWILNGICCEATAVCIGELSMRSDVRYMALDDQVELDDAFETEPNNRGYPPEEGVQWHVSKVRANEVWTYNGTSGYTGAGVVVAILDTGVNYRHADISGNMWDGVCNGENGEVLYPNHGWDFVDNDNDPFDGDVLDGHGSHVAGIVAGNNSVYQSGIAPGSTIMAIRVVGDNQSLDAFFTNTLCGLQFALEYGADVINASWGYNRAACLRFYREAMEVLLTAGVVVTKSAGNFGSKQTYHPVPNNISAPGGCPPPWHNPDQLTLGGASALICVGNTTQDDLRNATSSIGPVTWQDVVGYEDYEYLPDNPNATGLIRPDVSAPGKSIWSINRNDNEGYHTLSGTSMASPCVAGVIALMLEANPNLTPSQIDEILESTAVPCDGQTSKNNYYGAGRVDAYEAVTAALNLNTPQRYHINVAKFPFEDRFFVSGSGHYLAGSSCTIMASPTERFDRWEKDGEIVSNSAAFTIEEVTEDAEYIGFFYEGEIITEAFPAQGGSTSGDGMFHAGDLCTVTATPNPGFTFMGWYGNALGTMLYSRQPEYTFTVTRDRHLYAKFVLGNYTVTTSCSPAEGGSVTGGGTYMVGSTVTLTATANSGYVFSCWTEDGQVVSSQPTYSFTSLSDRHLVANFMQPTFSLGTLITNPDGSKGIVFYINPTYTGGCMVALEDVSTDCPWGNDADVTFVRNYTYTRNECLLSDLDGYANTAVLRENQSANPDYAPGRVDFEHGWYVPSAGQLRKIFSALPFIESAITNAGGTTLSDNGYWSSTENSASNAWSSTFELSSYSKTSNRSLRAVRDFSINNTLRVQVSTNNAELGNATGSGFYSIGAQVTVTATPTGDNLFRGWTEKGHLVSQDPTYTFSAYANRDLVANFAVRGGVGTLVTNPDGSQGVLFHVTPDGSQGWMVALEDASEGCQWGPESDIIIMKDQTVDCQSIFEDQSGYYNTKLIRMTQGTDNEYAASIVDFDNGWYLPSAGQLRKLYAELPMLEEALLRAGGSSLTDGVYWSSTEYSASAASTPGFALGTTSKTSNCRVRAIRNYIPDGDHVVFVASNDENFGTTSGAGEYDYNETVTVTAMPNEGYLFDHWTENGVTVSYDAEYQFPFTDSRSLVANFVVSGSIGSIIHNLDGSLGVVFYVNPEGTEGLMVALDDVAEECPWGTDGDILVMPNVMYTGSYALCDSLGAENTDLLRRCQGTETGYAADVVDVSNGWYLPSASQLRKLYAALPLIEEQLVFAGGSLLTYDSYWSSTEYSSSNAFSPMFEMSNSSKTANHRVRAIRSFLTSGVHSLAVRANDASFGSVSGSGEYEYGASATVVATPNEGFVFDHWTEDGATVSYNAIYQFTFTRNRSLVAHFMRSGSVGSIVTNVDGSQGIVFYADPSGYGGLMVALEDVSEGCQWGANEDVLSLENLNPSPVQYMLEDMNGSGNSNVLRTWQDDNPDYAVSQMDYANGWYLPSAGQMRKLYAALPLIEKAIVNAGGTLMNTDAYWTSSECSSSQAWSPSFEFTKTNKTNNLRVRAIRSTLHPVMIVATANPEEGGTVSGGGNYDCGATCTLSATPNEGYSFINWTKNGNVVSTETSYSFTVTEAAEYVANFELNTYDITAAANPTEGGTITGAGSYSHGTTATLTAIANEGFVFANWKKDGQQVSTSTSYSFTVTEDADFVANFEALPTYTVTATANPATGGTVSGGGTYYEGATCNLMATANEGYTFINWTKNGQSVSTNLAYSFTVTENVSLVANFELNTYEVTATANPSEGGTVSGAGTYYHGQSCALTATANEGYTFINWTANGTLLSTDPTYSFTVMGNTTCVARFLSGDATVQASTFTSGWNWYSTYIEQEGVDGLQILEDGLGENGVQIKSQQQYVNYYEGMGWMGMLSAIDNESTYKIKTNAACTVDMVGLETTSGQHPITVGPGWNWIGYPVNSSMSVATAFSNVTPASGDQVKAQNGYANYYDGMGWMGTLMTIEPSMGLLYKSNGGTNFTLVYPANSKGETLVENVTADNNHWVPDMHAYPDNMTVTAVVELDDKELNSDNYELAAFADGECRGSVRLMYVEPLNRHIAFLTITGEDVTALSFSLYDMQMDEEIHGANEQINFSNNATVGDVREPYVLHFCGITGVDEWANRLNVFPNPVACGEVLNIVMPAEDLGKMRVEIINALGVVEACHGASLQTITAPDVAGVYTLHITVEGKGTCYRKLVVK